MKINTEPNECQRTVHKKNGVARVTGPSLHQQLAKRKSSVCGRNKQKTETIHQNARTDAQVGTRTSVVQLRTTSAQQHRKSLRPNRRHIYSTVPNRNKNKRLCNMRSEGRDSQARSSAELSKAPDGDSVAPTAGLLAGGQCS